MLHSLTKARVTDSSATSAVCMTGTVLGVAGGLASYPHNNPRGRLSLFPFYREVGNWPQITWQVLDEVDIRPRLPGSRVYAHKHFTLRARRNEALPGERLRDVAPRS